jgi:hypothetical protein
MHKPVVWVHLHRILCGKASALMCPEPSRKHYISIVSVHFVRETRPQNRAAVLCDTQTSQVFVPLLLKGLEHPAGYHPLLAHSRRRSLLPSRIPARSASGKHKFRGRSPTARTFACLRIAAAISGTVARLATGRAGSPFAGRVLHPLDDKQHFMEDVRPPIPIDPQGLVALDFLSVPGQEPRQRGAEDCAPVALAKSLL